MEYVHVASKPQRSGVDYNHAIMAQSNLCLYSIIEGMRQKNFNTHTLGVAIESIKDFYALYVCPNSGKVYIDSGGYSIIVGNIHPETIPRFVQCYNAMLRLEADSFDRIFSLDIPWSKGFPEMNTRRKIMDFNDYSLATAREILLDRPEALERYSFVWHFKMKAQYEIWNHLYDKYDLNNLIHHRAIGGMVALRGATGISFSPFIGMAYRCLVDFMDGPQIGKPFSLHYLGMYLQYDRFEMAILDRLFARYLEGETQILTTYDSVNPMHSARLDTALKLFEFEGNGIHVYNNLVEAPARIIEHVYRDKGLIDFVQEEISRRQGGDRLQNASSFGPLNIFSHRQVDQYFEYVVGAHGLAEVFFQEWSLTKINGYFETTLSELAKQCPVLFTEHLRKAIMENVAITYQFHRWFVDDRSRAGLDRLILSNIRKIKFPGDLK